MLPQLQHTINHLFPNKKTTFLLAISGGIDSMVLLHLFNELKLNIVVAHVNYQLRGDESNLDEQLVKQTCEHLDVPFKSIRFNTKEKINESKGSLQMVARELRYNWFETLKKDYNKSILVTAHHLNDQIETFFINLTRGTGIDGLTGMQELQSDIFRPLLSYTKNDLYTFAATNNISFREDASNKENKYKRNKLRNEIIPLFLEMNPSFERTMFSNMNLLKGTNSIVEDTISDKLKKEIVRSENNRFFLSIENLRNITNGNFYLFQFLNDYGFNKSQIDAIYEGILNAHHSGKMFYSPTYQLLIDREELILSPIQKELNPLVEIKKMDKNVTYPLFLSFDTKPREIVTISPNSLVAYIDMEKITFPLYLRKWKKGDVFKPLGMTGKKKLSDFLIDNKVSRTDKNETYVITSKDKIIWVVGHRICDSVKLTSNTSNVLVITLKPN